MQIYGAAITFKLNNDRIIEDLLIFFSFVQYLSKPNPSKIEITKRISSLWTERCAHEKDLLKKKMIKKFSTQKLLNLATLKWWRGKSGKRKNLKLMKDKTRHQLLPYWKFSGKIKGMLSYLNITLHYKTTAIVFRSQNYTGTGTIKSWAWMTNPIMNIFVT